MTVLLIFAISFSFNVLTRDNLLGPQFDAWLGVWGVRLQTFASIAQVVTLLAWTGWIFRRQAVPVYFSDTVASLRTTATFRLLGKAPIALLVRATTWLAASVAIVWLYAWMASGGTFRFDSASTPYADMLADAFLAGQLNLLVEPSPALLALPDPYDAVMNKPFRLPDASLFNGHYYLYFGPVPGLIHAAWKLLTGSRLEEGAMLMVAGVAGCFWFLLVVRRLRRLTFPELSPAWERAAAVCYALGGVGLFLVSRPIGHHESILVASAFVLGG
ncbi:MAG TPA: hypothetical protein VFB89_10330, partial [Gemmatimonadales bacterium]|nr:hypothetical protein [Gemmatimonadales bacterium]